MVERICSCPRPWDQIFRRLLQYADAHPCTPPRPPTPLILNGWSFSNDTEKRVRWRETVAWAKVNGCSALIEGIPDEDFYQAVPRN
jgi:hypothetical protein